MRNAGQIVKAGLIVGTLDMAAACYQFWLNTGRGPAVVQRYIASALFPKNAMSEGLTIAVGLLMHYAIAFAFTILFFWITQILPSLLRQRFLLGSLYGVLIWVVMNLLLLPLTRAAQPPFSVNGVLIGIGILIAAIGLPLALWLRPAPVSHQ